MDRYQLAKLVQWAGVLRSRKRLQKVAFLIQEAGCPLNAEYTLHFYGPYSRDVAAACDQLVASSLVREQTGGNAVGVEYSYSLTDEGVALLRDIESDPTGASSATQLEMFRSLSQELLKEDLRDLEIGSTIAYFRRGSAGWEEALRRACEFKKIDRSKVTVDKALELAQRVHGWPGATGTR